MKRSFTLIILLNLVFSIQNLEAVNQLSNPNNEIVTTEKLTWKQKIASKILKKRLKKAQIKSEDEGSGLSPLGIIALAFLGLTVIVILVNGWLILITIPMAALFGIMALFQSFNNAE